MALFKKQQDDVGLISDPLDIVEERPRPKPKHRPKAVPEPLPQSVIAPVTLEEPQVQEPEPELQPVGEAAMAAKEPQVEVVQTSPEPENDPAATQAEEIFQPGIQVGISLNAPPKELVPVVEQPAVVPDEQPEPQILDTPDTVTSVQPEVVVPPVEPVIQPKPIQSQPQEQVAYNSLSEIKKRLHLGTSDQPAFSLPEQKPVELHLAEEEDEDSSSKGRGIFGAFMKPISREELEEKKKRLEELESEKKAAESLAEVERTYREGLTTLKDLLAPASLKFQSSHFELNGKYARSFFVLAYPRFLSSNWLSFIINAEGALDVSIFIYPIDSETILKKLKSKVGEIGSQMAIQQQKGMVRDPMLETAYHDVEQLRDDLMQGTEKYFRVALYFTLYAKDLKELDTNSATLESALGSKLIVTKRALMQTQSGYNSTLPLGVDELDVANNMNTSPLSTTFPFVSSDLTSNDGILYGINRHNNSLILFDRFAMENANSVVFAKSGAGKSYAVKLEILRWLMVGADVIVIDPENEYKHLADAVGGAYLNVSLNSDSRINPFDLPVAIEGEDNADVLRSAVVNLLGLFSLMLGKLNPTEEAIMDKAIWQTYAKKDITETADLRAVEYPTMNDLLEILHGTVGAESLAQRMEKFTEGTFSGLFNQPTNVVLNNQLVVFSIRDLEDELRPIAMYIVLGYIWNVVRSELKKRILVIDEAWIMMQHEDSARFLFGMAKRARKYYLGVTTITQDVADFMASPYGKPIVTNSSIQLLLKQSPAAINIIAETFFLTEGEKYLLLESEVGEGIFFAGLKHAAIKIYASYVEDQIITTDPKQLLEIQDSQEQPEE